jgi:hypothetical protein
MNICRLSIFLLSILYASPGLTAQMGNITGITINTECTLMYYIAEKSGECALYKAVKNSSENWGAGVSENSFNEHIKGYTVKTPFLTCDGQTLYFSANLPGAKGFDIFYSKKHGDSWQKPVSLSAVINTGQDEISPSLSADNATIYFTRSGLESDCYSIYRSEIDVSGWSVPQILPPPINVGCEKYVHISPSGEMLLFSTDRLSEKKRKKYTVFYSGLIGRNIWTPPSPIDNSMKEYDEFTPVVDNKSDKIYITTGGIDSTISNLLSYEIPVQAVSKAFTILKGTVKEADGKPANAEITIKNSYTDDVYGKSNSDPATGEYTVVLPNDGMYNVNYFIKNGAQRFVNIKTSDNKPSQVINKDITLISKLTVNVNVQDALSNKFIDAEIQAYEKTKTAKVSKLGEGKYQVVTPIFENVDIELYKENYMKENIIVNFSDYAEFSEMYYSIKLRPDLRSGEINVKDISSNQGINANVAVKNLNIEDDEVIIAVPDTGRYVFSLRKDCKYSISVTLKDYVYYYAVWKADVGRVGQMLDVRPVPLEETSKVPMLNLLFPDGESTLLPEAAGELSCVIETLRNNPEYTATISLYHLNNAAELAVAQQRARSIVIFMDSNRIPVSGYKVEILPVDDKAKIPDVNFVLNVSAVKK